MRHGSLFSGIGGFDLAASWMGWENVFQVEWDDYCQKILVKNFPNVKRYGDIREFDGTKYRGLIDIITGGFPCQPFSVAGKQKGKSDERYLWPEMLRVIREIQPSFVVGENVPGIIKLELENICTSLESEGYEVQPFIIPSASIGAWDKRERVWIVAYNNQWSRSEYGLQAGREMSERNFIEINPNSHSFDSNNAGHHSGPISQQQATRIQVDSDTNSKGLQKSGLESGKQEVYEEIRTKYCDCLTSDTISSGRENRLHGREQIWKTGERINSFKESDWWKRNWIEVASELCRSDARVPNRMDRIKALGNSINPYVAFEIFKAIERLETELKNHDKPI